MPQIAYFAGAVELRADLSRAQRRVLRTLEEAAGPLTLIALSAATGSHPNTLREHLAVLVAEGLVTVETEQPETPRRGRPALRYQRAPATADLASIANALAEEIRQLPDRDEFSLRAGARWEALVGRTASADIMEQLTELGFTPERTDEGVVMHTCPVAGVASTSSDIVCRMHLGAILHSWPDIECELIPAGEPTAHRDGCLLRTPVPVEKPDAESAT